MSVGDGLSSGVPFQGLKSAQQVYVRTGVLAWPVVKTRPCMMMQSCRSPPFLLYSCFLRVGGESMACINGGEVCCGCAVLLRVTLQSNTPFLHSTERPFHVVSLLHHQKRPAFLPALLLVVSLVMWLRRVRQTYPPFCLNPRHSFACAAPPLYYAWCCLAGACMPSDAVCWDSLFVLLPHCTLPRDFLSSSVDPEAL